MKKKTIIRRRRLTPVQSTVLRNLSDVKLSKVPRNSLEALEKKGLVSGDRRRGWQLTRAGHEWLATEDNLGGRKW
jgi:Mn-dependent DtxR family transcriptional regulator